MGRQRPGNDAPPAGSTCPRSRSWGTPSGEVTADHRRWAVRAVPVEPPPGSGPPLDSRLQRAGRLPSSGCRPAGPTVAAPQEDLQEGRRRASARRCRSAVVRPLSEPPASRRQWGRTSTFVTAAWSSWVGRLVQACPDRGGRLVGAGVAASDPLTQSLRLLGQRLGRLVVPSDTRGWAQRHLPHVRVLDPAPSAPALPPGTGWAPARPPFPADLEAWRSEHPHHELVLRFSRRPEPEELGWCHRLGVDELVLDSGRDDEPRRPAPGSCRSCGAGPRTRRAPDDLSRNPSPSRRAHRPAEDLRAPAGRAGRGCRDRPLRPRATASRSATRSRSSATAWR